MDFSNIMKQAAEMQSRMKEIQDGLARKTITGSAGGGMVTVTVTGNSDVLGVTIEDALISSGEKTMLQDLITAATNDAMRKAKELSQNEMKKLAGGLSIPGLSNLF